MIEKELEDIIIDKLTTNLSAYPNIKIIGAWQTADEGEVKGLDDDESEGIVAVKVNPRQYETPTIPDAEVGANVTLVVRADVDKTGINYLDVTDIISSTLHEYQKSFFDYHEEFKIDDKFEPTGFRLDGGDCGMDRENCTWTYNQQFTLIGIII